MKENKIKAKASARLLLFHFITVALYHL